jgi:hypothetical protein
MLKQELCPKCTFISLDPGGYRRRRHAAFTCHRHSLAFANLSNEVIFVDDLSPAGTARYADTHALPRC